MNEDNEKKQFQDKDMESDSTPVEDRAGVPLEEALKDPGFEALKKFAPLILIVVVAVFAIFAFFKWRESSNQESQALIDREYLNALKSPKDLLSFANENLEEPLAGVALYRAASAQYLEEDFTAAAETFGRAASLLGGDEPLPLAGRAALGQGVSLIRAGKAKEGKIILDQVIKNTKYASSARGEAWHHLGIQALSDGDDAAYSRAEKALSGDKAFDKWHDVLSHRKEVRDFIAKASKRRKVPVPEKNLKASQEFLDQNKKREGVVTLESGLQYEMLVEGNGTSPTAVDDVEVHFHGTLMDGEVFDSSVDRGSPSILQLGSVIAGWTEGLQLMKTGGKRKFFIPPDLAYKETGSGRGIGPNEALIFEIELLQVIPPDENASAVESPTSAGDSNATNPALPTISAGDSNATTPPLPVIPPVESNATKKVAVPASENNGSK